MTPHGTAAKRMGPLAYLNIGLLGCLLVSPFADGIHEGCHLPDWLSYGGHCYGFLYDQVNWHQGQVRCGNLGGDLGSLESDEEFEAVASFLKRLGVYEDVWIEQPLKKAETDEANVCPALDSVTGYLQRVYIACGDKLSFICETKT